VSAVDANKWVSADSNKCEVSAVWGAGIGEGPEEAGGISVATSACEDTAGTKPSRKLPFSKDSSKISSLALGESNNELIWGVIDFKGEFRGKVEKLLALAWKTWVRR